MTRTVAQALAWGQKTLTREDIASAALDVRLLLCHTAGLTREDVIRTPERSLSESEERKFKELVARRAAHEPVAYLTGHREFWGLDFLCAPGVLIPRPDSETLVEAALGLIPDKSAPLNILDLGTGTGALLLALLHELPVARGIGTDISPAAVDIARANADRLGLAGRTEIRQTHWAKGVSGRFDLVISNPPYIAAPDMAGLAPDIRDYEPKLALAAGPGGLDAYRALSRLAGGIMAAKGRVVMETGQGQGGAVRQLFLSAEWAFLASARDLNGIERVQCFEKV